jgi:anhydro-N-acetylmuramic acid kinase
MNMHSATLTRNNTPSTSPRTGLTRAIGLMSGTSLDGVDAALIETDGLRQVKSLGFVTVPYPAGFRERVRATFGKTTDPDGVIKALARDLTDHHLAAILSLLVQTGFQADEIDIIGFHGQTITHLPDQHFTWQIGDPQHLAQTLGCPVVFDFRMDDVAAGGQGAPLLPVYHQARVAQAGLPLPLAMVNIGGVGNITWIGPNDGDLIAFDTGPGNALIDDLMLKRTGHSCDLDGEAAARGHVHQDMVDQWMGHRYFTVTPPKSLDRNDFNVGDIDALSTDDAAATLTAFTADSIVAAFRFLPAPPTRLLVTGGGRSNPTMMKFIRERLKVPVEAVDSYRFNGDAMEAEGFAYMAVRTLKDLPISFPGTTGAPHPMQGGKVYQS